MLNPGNRNPLLASFYFWRIGSERQRSLAGLYRSLLHDILEACPELIRQVLPDYWKQAKEMPWQIQTHVNITGGEIKAAFTRLIAPTSENADLHETRCFCLFIDGLDEYGQTDGDYLDMVGLFRDWTTGWPQGVKLCVSSRPDNVFMDAAFCPQENRIQIHDLTRDDMRVCISDRLEGIPDREFRAHVVDEINNKAQGIFQWVVLVVKQLRKELSNEPSRNDLMAKVGKYPAGLDKLYGHVLDSIQSDGDPEAAYRLFAMMSFSTEHDVGLSLLKYSFFDEYSIDVEFAMKESFPQKVREPPTPADRVSRARKLVNDRSRGLVEVGVVHNVTRAAIHYAHRSIPEFLDRHETKKMLEPFLQGFIPVDALSQLSLAQVWAPLQGGSFSWPTYLVALRHQVGIDREPPFKFLDFIADKTCKGFWEGMDKYSGAGLSIGTGRQRVDVVRVKRGGGHELFGVDDPLYIATLLGHRPYIMWRLENYPGTTKLAVQREMLCHTVLASQCVLGKTDYSAVGFLLERGLISGRTPTRFIPTISGIYFEHGPDLTFWQQYLLVQFCFQFFWHGEAGQGHGGPERAGRVFR